MVSKNKISPAELSRFPIFARLSQKQLVKIAAIIRNQTFKDGEEITCEGEHGDELFLLLSGKVGVSKSLTLKVGREGLDTRDKSLIQMRAEDAPYFGEMALLREDSLRTATVKAVGQCHLGMIKRDSFIKLCESDYELGYLLLMNIARTLAAHLEKTSQDVLKLTTAFSLALQS